MDPVIFTGRMSLGRFKDERPLEYERMVAEDTLAAHMAPAPTPAEMRRAHIFGFSGLSVGVALAVLIFLAIAKGLVH